VIASEWGQGSHLSVFVFFVISFRIQPPSEKALLQEQSYKLAAATGPMLLSAVVDQTQTRTTISFMTLVS